MLVRTKPRDGRRPLCAPGLANGRWEAVASIDRIQIMNLDDLLAERRSLPTALSHERAGRVPGTARETDVCGHVLPYVALPLTKSAPERAF
jgi:hypothetical protein